MRFSGSCAPPCWRRAKVHGCVSLLFHAEFFLADPATWTFFKQVVALCQELGARSFRENCLARLNSTRAATGQSLTNRAARVNVLLINHYAGSLEYGMEYRPYYLAREWVRVGHSVTVAAASFSHLRSRQPSGQRDGREHIDGIRYVWLKAAALPRQRLAAGVEHGRLRAAMGRHETAVTGGGRPDAVVASSPHPFVIFPARRIARRAARGWCSRSATSGR